MLPFLFALTGLLTCADAVPAPAEKTVLEAFLQREIIGPRQTLVETQDYLEGRIPRLPSFSTPKDWDAYARQLRSSILERAVFRGAAAAWRDAPLKVEWFDTLPGGPGYRIRKLRYEAVPGLWIPALLYEPEKLEGKVPVVLNVNGHDANGKQAPYKQLRCINLAKRGMLALNPEWVGMGQLRGAGYRHGCMNQLDLCGTSGLAVFYLNMQRGLDVLLSLPHADAERTAVTGLSGGGWQTIILSSLDPRVKLANPVAGYSSFRTRIRHFKDLGDSEQTPCDLATLADYTHLTALMAPRPTLLTYCAKDDCCFEAGYALPPLLNAAAPVFKLLGKNEFLRSHVNHVPGTHNYEKDNREAIYRMLGDHFFTGQKFNAEEIPSEKEVKSREELMVDLPEKNANFQTLALALGRDLPRGTLPDGEKDKILAWQKAQRVKLREVVKAMDYPVEATRLATEEKEGVRATFWKLHLGKTWTVPVVELVRGEPKGTTILFNDAGRRADPINAERLLKAGQRVLAVDPFYFGELKLERDYLFALLVGSVGDRPLGIQASQLAAVARWSEVEHKSGPVSAVAVGPRSSAIVLTAAALEVKSIGHVELHGSLGSLKEVLEQNRSFEQMPELFCFGLLESFDVNRLAMLVAPRPVVFVQPRKRVREEMAGVMGIYAALGKEWNPIR